MSYIVTNVTDKGGSQDFEDAYNEVAQALLSGDYTPKPIIEEGNFYDVTWRDTNDNEVTMTEIIEQATGDTGVWTVEEGTVDDGDYDEDGYVEYYITYVASCDAGGPTVPLALLFTVTIGEAT